jgi:hypothetical protein
MNGAPDFTTLFNTQLAPADEAAFQAWAQKAGRQHDLFDYDLRGAWKENAQESANGHLPDTYKKPNHPTFSNESIYNGVEGMSGGQWLQTSKGWQFIPSATNLHNYPLPDLQRYFKTREPDAVLAVPR